jgi:hypothetical protein
MAGFVPSPNTVAVRLRWLFNNTTQYNILHGQYTIAGPLSPNIAENIFSAIKANAAWTTFAGHLATTMGFAGVDVLDLRSPNIPPVSSTSLISPGTGTGAALGPQNSTVMTLRTAFTGRSFRGRTFLFGYTVAATDANGHIVAQVNTDAVAFMNAVQAAMSAQAITLAIRSPALPSRPSKPGGTLPPKDFTITPVTLIQARDTVWDTNRRRLDIFRR